MCRTVMKLEIPWPVRLALDKNLLQVEHGRRIYAGVRPELDHARDGTAERSRNPIENSLESGMRLLDKVVLQLHPVGAIDALT